MTSRNEENRSVKSVLERLKKSESGLGSDSEIQPNDTSLEELLADLNQLGTGPLGNLAYADKSKIQMDASREMGREANKIEQAIQNEIKGIFASATSPDELFRNLRPYLYKLKALIIMYEGSPEEQARIIEYSIIDPLEDNVALHPWHDKILTALTETDLLKRLKETGFLDSSRLDDYYSRF